MNSHDLAQNIRTAEWMVEKIRTRDDYAQNIYAALCNNEFQPQEVWPVLKNQRWSCSWRYAGGIIADIRGYGDYMDWYCSGSLGNPDNHGHTPGQYVPESTITDEVRQDLQRLGWVVCFEND